MTALNNAPSPSPISWNDGVKQKLIGLGPWLAGAAAEGYTYDHIQNKVIPAAIREFERYCNYRINLVQIVTRPDFTYQGTVSLMTNPATGAQTSFTVPVIERDGMLMRTQDMDEYFATHLFEHPVRMVQRMRIMLNDQGVYEIPTMWFNIEERTGKLSLLPIYGPLFMQSVVALVQLNISMAGKEYIPNALCIDYIAGMLPGWQDDYEYSDLRRALEQFCALKVLEDVQELADAGLTAVGTDGESRQYSRFEKLKAELSARVDAFKTLWDAQENSPMIGWV